MSKIFITGGAGFVGSHLVDKLLDRGEEVTVLDIHKNIPKNLIAHKDAKNFNYIHGNVMDKTLLENILTKDYDKIFHLGAVVGVKNYCENPLQTIDINFGGTRNIVDIALRKDIKIIFSSTSEIFGKNPIIPWEEDSDRVLGATSIDRWCYSSSKSLCEHMLFAINKKYALPTVIVRYFNVYGPRQKPIFVVPAMINKILNNKSPIVFDDGNQTRCFTFIDDAVEGTIKASESSNAIGKSFNLGSSYETSISDLASKIVNISGNKDVKIDYINTDKIYKSYEDLKRRVPSTARAKDVLDWEATTNLEEGLFKTYQWYAKNFII